MASSPAWGDAPAASGSWSEAGRYRPWLSLEHMEGWRWGHSHQKASCGFWAVCWIEGTFNVSGDPSETFMGSFQLIPLPGSRGYDKHRWPLHEMDWVHSSKQEGPPTCPMAVLHASLVSSLGVSRSCHNHLTVLVVTQEKADLWLVNLKMWGF